MKIKIIIGFVIPAGIVIGLYFLQASNATGKYGFQRKLRVLPIDKMKKLILRDDSYYIAGISKERFYLGNYAYPEDILSLNYDLTDTLSIYLQIPQNLKVAWRTLKTTVVFPDIYSLEGVSPNIFFGKLPERLLRQLQAVKGKFDLAIPLSPSLFFVRSYNDSLQSLALRRLTGDPASPEPVWFGLEKQQDGIFSVDGSLTYDAKTNRLIYVYTYRNQFDCLDTNLQMVKRGRTIDTISRAQLNIAAIAAEGKVTLTSPPLIVNRRCAADNGRLLINSGLVADNEDPTIFQKFPVIDVYDIVNATYLYSYYLPNEKNNRISEFSIRDEHMVILQDKMVTTLINKDKAP